MKKTKTTQKHYSLACKRLIYAQKPEPTNIMHVKL